MTDDIEKELQVLKESLKRGDINAEEYNLIAQQITGSYAAVEPVKPEKPVKPKKPVLTANDNDMPVPPPLDVEPKIVPAAAPIKPSSEGKKLMVINEIKDTNFANRKTLCGNETTGKISVGDVVLINCASTKINAVIISIKSGKYLRDELLSTKKEISLLVEGKELNKIKVGDWLEKI